MTNTLEGFKLVPRGEPDNSDVAYALYEGNYENLLRAIPDAPTEALREVVEAAQRIAHQRRRLMNYDRSVLSPAELALVGLIQALSRLEAAVGGKGDGNG